MRICVWVLLVCVQVGIGQNMDHYLVSNAGGLSEQIDYQLSFTAGESAVHTLHTSGMFVLNQGFQQSDDILVSKIRSIEGYQVNVSVYPNPTAGEIVVQMDQTKTSGYYQMHVYNMHGQIVDLPGSNEVFHQTSHVLDFGKASGGVYYVEIEDISRNLEVGSFKILRKN